MKYVYLILCMAIVLAAYTAVGMLFHWMFVGDVVNYHSALSLGVIFAWPVLAILVLTAIATVICAGVYLHIWWTSRKDERLF